MTIELLIASHNKKSEEYKVIEETLKGKEFDIPEQYAWPDKEGQLRTSNRTKWWIDPRANFHGKWLFNCPHEMESLLIPGESNPMYILQMLHLCSSAITGWKMELLLSRRKILFALITALLKKVVWLPIGGVESRNWMRRILFG